MKASHFFIKATIISTLIAYVTFAGLLVILALLSWITWPFVAEWAGRVGLITLLIVILMSVVALLSDLLKK